MLAVEYEESWQPGRGLATRSCMSRILKIKFSALYTDECILILSICSSFMAIADWTYEMKNWFWLCCILFSMRSWTVLWRTLSRIVTSGWQRLIGCGGRRAGSPIHSAPLIRRQWKRTSTTATRWSSSRPEYSKTLQVRNSKTLQVRNGLERKRDEFKVKFWCYPSCFSQSVFLSPWSPDLFLTRQPFWFAIEFAAVTITGRITIKDCWHSWILFKREVV